MSLETGTGSAVVDSSAQLLETWLCTHAPGFALDVEYSLQSARQPFHAKVC